MARTVLIYASVPLWEYHNAESVELALEHVAQGDDVHILTCKGALHSCAANAKHLRALCSLCLHHQRRTQRILGIKNVTWHTLTLDRKSQTFPSFPSISALRDFAIDDVPHGAFVASQLVDNTRDGYPEMEKHAAICNRLLGQSVALYSYASRLIRRINAQQVYVWNGRRPSDGPVVSAARKLNIPFTTHLWDTDEPWGLTRGFIVIEGSTLHDLNRMRDAVRADKTSEDLTVQQYEAGVSYLNDLAPAGRRLFGTSFRDAPLDFLSRDAHKVAIFTSSEWEFAGEPTWKNRLYPSQWAGIARIVTDKAFLSGCQLVVRLHPNLINSPRDSGEWKTIRAVQATANPGVHFVEPDDPVDSYRLMQACDTVATFGSTVGVESAWRGKPVVLLGCAAYEGAGICYEPKDHDEVVKLLTTRALDPTKLEDVVRYGYRRFANVWTRVQLRHLRLDNLNRVWFRDYQLCGLSARVRLRRLVGRMVRRLLRLPLHTPR